MKIALIGTGLYSTSLAKIFSEIKENEICLWTEQKSLVDKFKKTHKFDFLPKNTKLPENVSITSSLEEALKSANTIFILVSSQFFEETIKQMKPYYKKKIPIFVGTKGMMFQNQIYFSDYTRKKLKCNSYTFFAGPTLAADLLLDFPCYLTFAGSNKSGYRKLSKIVPKRVHMTYTDDLNGLELLSTLKNIYAIGSGILHGLNVPEGIYYGYMTHVMIEIQKLLNKAYKSQETLFTYGGLGDLLMTTNSQNSRNFTFGKLIGKKAGKEEIAKFKKKNTIEGLYHLKEMHEQLKKWHIKNSIIDQIFNIVLQDEKPESLYLPMEEEKNDFLD